MDRDRNLLFGIYALRLEQVTLHDLIDATAKWATDPSRDLSEYLIEVEALCVHDRDFINWTVERAVQHYGGDEASALDHLGREEALQATFQGTIELADSGGVNIVIPPTSRSDVHSQIATLPSDSNEAGQLKGDAPPGMHHYSTREHLETIVRRHSGALVTVATTAILLCALAGYYYRQLYIERREATLARDTAEVSRLLAETNKEEAIAEREQAERFRREAEAARDAEAQERARAERQMNLALTEALQAHRSTMNVIRAQLKDDPENVSIKRSLAETYKTIGLVQSQLGDYSIALSFDGRRMDIIQALLEADPENVSLKTDLADCFSMLGNHHRNFGEHKKARHAYTSSLNISYGLLMDEPRNAAILEAARNTHLSASKLSFLEERLGASLQELSAAFDMAQTLVEIDVNNERYQDMLGADYERFASTYTEMGEPRLAADALEKAYEGYTQRVHLRAVTTITPSDVTRVYTPLARLYKNMAEQEKLLTLRESYIELRQRLADLHPDDPEAQWDLSRTYTAMGVAYKKEGDDQKAVSAYQASLDIIDRIVDGNPTNESFHSEKEHLQLRLKRLRNGR